MHGRGEDKSESSVNSTSDEEIRVNEQSSGAGAADGYPHDDGFNNDDFDLNCFSGVWQGISELGSKVLEVFKEVVSACWSGISEFFGMIGESIKSAFEGIFRGIGIVFGAIGTGLMWIGRVILKPVFVSGANVSGFFLDKFLLGSPGLHDYFQHGLWPSNVPTAWRDWVRNNSGWDIYETMGKVGDNVVGALLGGGIGWLTLFNHFVTSLWRNMWNGSHLLGKEGIFGERHPLADQRNIVVKILFGLLSLPLVVPVLAITNSFDALGALAKNLWFSFSRNLRCSMNFLGEHGVFGKCAPYVDSRHLAVRIMFGALTLPFVAPLALITNAADLLITGIYHIFHNTKLSLYHNLRSTFNIVLGKHGRFGEWNGYNDTRNKAVRILFGALTLPIVAPLAVITNAVDLITTGIWQFIKQSGLSFYRNLRSNMNFLSEYGVFGKRTPYADDRNLAVRIIFGALTFPLVAPLALVTNAADLLFTSVYHIYNNVKLSLYHNLRSTFNMVLGKYGMFGEWRTYNDTRNKAVRILFGALTLPIVAPLAIASNALDILLKGAWEIFRHSLLSIGYNLQKTFNIVLGGWGVLGNKRHKYEDNRNLAVRIVFGVLTLPVVVPLAIISNTFDIVWSAIWQTIKHSALSLFFNINNTFNIVLGKHGIFCERSDLQDSRNLAVRLLFGALTLPVVAPIVAVTNGIDLVVTGIQQFFKHSALSISRNLSRSFNIVMGDVGLFGPRHLFKDPRNLAVKILFGALTLPVVAPIALLTNSMDLVGSYFKHWHYTILKPAILTTGIVALASLAIPTFVLRKTCKGLYNCLLRPFVDCIQGRTPDGWSMLKGATNVVSLGGFSLATKVFKACTGYTHRFGFAYRAAPQKNGEKEELVTHHFTAAQIRFREAIHLATKGKLPGAQDKMGYFRPVMRVFYGLRNKAEEILKAYHDEYLAYVDRKTLKGKDIASLSINGFFNRKTAEKFAAIEERVKVRVNLHDDEITMLNAVKGYLLKP